MHLRSSSGRGFLITVGLTVLALSREGLCDDDKETARLAYTISADVPGCPDEASFRNLVAARLGYDPFVPAGRHDAAVSIGKQHGKLVARARVTRQGQAEPGVRELGGAPDQCEALALALATTVAIALDPVRGSRGPDSPPPPQPPPAPAPEPAPAAAPPPAPTVLRPLPLPPLPPPAFAPGPEPIKRRAPVSLFAVANGVGSIGAAPGPSLGGEIGLGLGVSAFSIAGALRIETTPGATIAASGAHLEATLISGDVIPCANLGRWSACGLVRLGALEGRSPNVVDPTTGSSLYFALGARGGYTLPITKALAISASLEAAFPLVRTVLNVDHEVAWRAPRISAGLDLGVRVTFF